MPAAYCTLPNSSAGQTRHAVIQQGTEARPALKLPLHNQELKTQLLLSMQGPALKGSKTETQAAMRPHWIPTV